MQKTEPAREFQLPLRVYIEDTDAGGIVYYVNYLKFMERGRTELMRSLGYDKPAILDEGRLLVVHSAQVNYRKPARLDEQLIATAAFAKLSGTSVVFHQRILRLNEQGQNGGEELLCEGNIKVACVTADSMRPTAIPEEMRVAIANYLESEA